MVEIFQGETFQDKKAETVLSQALVLQVVDTAEVNPQQLLAQEDLGAEEAQQVRVDQEIKVVILQ